MDKRLSVELGRIFTEEIQKVFDREIAEADFMPQGDYDSCLERAQDMVAVANSRATGVLGIAIAKHREKDHGEDRSAERDSLVKEVTQEDASIGLMSWWNP